MTPTKPDREATGSSPHGLSPPSQVGPSILGLDRAHAFPQFRERGRSRSQEEPPQRRRIGITRQAGEVLEDTILAEQLRRLDTLQPEEHRTAQREEHLADTVAVIALNESDLSGDSILESDPGQETVQEINAPVVGQRPCAKRDSEWSGSSRHLSESYFFRLFSRKCQRASSWKSENLGTGRPGGPSTRLAGLRRGAD
jgi:hypothetical protein